MVKGRISAVYQQYDEIGKLNLKTLISPRNHMIFIWKMARTRGDKDLSTKLYEYHLKTVKVTISTAHHENITLHNSMKK